MIQRSAAWSLGGIIVLSCGSALAQQQDTYPSRLIRMIVPQPAGGTTDVLGRFVSQKITEATGQQAIVENRGGAGGNIGTEIVAKARPDGYTLLTVASSTLTINPSLFPKMPYDTLQDLAPITTIAEVPNVLVAHPSLPVRNVKELIALARAKPNQLNYGSSGSGQSSHLAMELFKAMAGVDIIHIPYKGGNQLVMDVLAGQILLMMNNITTALPHIKAGKLRALGVTTLKRSPAMPELPAIDEAGLPGFENSVWYGVLAPAGTPVPIINRLNSIVVKALNMPDMRERLSNQGAEPVGNTPDESAAQLRADIAKWAKVIKATGAKLD